MVVAALALLVASNQVACTWRNVEIVGGGFVTGVITHPSTKGLVYAPTDFGGTFCFDNKIHRYIWPRHCLWDSK